MINWINVDRSKYATRGQLLDENKEPIVEYVSTVKVNTTIQEFKLYDVSQVQNLPRLNKSDHNKLLKSQHLMNALYVLNSRAKQIGKILESHKKKSYLTLKEKTELESEQNKIYLNLKAPALRNLYGENRIELLGFDLIGTDVRKHYLFQYLPYSFHTRDIDFSPEVTGKEPLNHLNKFPEGPSKTHFYTLEEAEQLVREYINKYIPSKTL
jgi:hypothetical protein